MKLFWKIKRAYRRGVFITKLGFLLFTAFFLLKYLDPELYMKIFNQSNAQLIFENTIKVISLILIIFFLAKLIPWYLERRKFKRASITTIDKMDGFEFERFLTFYFNQIGYKAEKTPDSNDWGADILVSINGIKTVIQAKRYKNKVDVKAIQEVVAAKNYYHADHSIVITNSVYTQPAIELAEANNVELWDRKKLINELARVNIRKLKRSTQYV